MDISWLKNQWIIHVKYFLLCAVLFTLLFKCALALRSNETDRLALLALKDRLVGGSPGALTSWNASLHFCEWQGVRCGHRHQRVISLNVSSMKLVGSISLSIGNLTFLREVNFSRNRLQGSIPRELGHLRRLRLLALGHNNLQVIIPVELSNCSNLQVIYLDYNNLTGEIPFQLGNVKNLIVLQLSINNLIGGIPSSFGNLSSLIVLSLQGNNLEGTIPNALGRLSNLEHLYIGVNNLSSSILPIYNLSSMIIIDAAENKLCGRLSPEIGLSFPNLEALYIGKTSSLEQFQGQYPISLACKYLTLSVPDNMGNLKNLLELSISGNDLGSGKEGDLNFLSSLRNCSRLQSLAIQYNRLGGVIPNSIANLSSSLQKLVMGWSQITGSIPEGIGNLVNLDMMIIGSSFVVGEIPISIGNLQNLEGLYLHSNHLTGKIPSTIGNLSRLCACFIQ